MGLKRLTLALWLLLSAAPAATASGMNGGHFGAGGAGHPGAGPQVFAPSGRENGGAIVNRWSWRGGHWWRGTRGNRLGWWWIVGPAWFWYPTAVYPYPDFYALPYLSSGVLYWCDFYENYDPNLTTCPTGWQVIQPE